MHQYQPSSLPAAAAPGGVLGAGPAHAFDGAAVALRSSALSDGWKAACEAARGGEDAGEERDDDAVERSPSCSCSWLKRLWLKEGRWASVVILEEPCFPSVRTVG